MKEDAQEKTSEGAALHPARQRLVQGLTLVEDIVYGGLGVLLAISALALLVSAFLTLVHALRARTLGNEVVGLLDQLLLVLLVIELLYTVQVSFRLHGLVAEPFLIVALIAVIRRILVITAEVPKLVQSGEAVFRHAIIELALLTVMILVLVGSFKMLQRHGRGAEQR